MKVAIFDLDGVVIDTESLIRHAYEDAGAPEPPPDFMHVTWREWLIPLMGSERLAYEIKCKKDEIYVELLRGAPLLSGYYAARSFAQVNTTVGLLTAAPWKSIPVLRKSFAIWPFDFAVANVRGTDKADIMWDLEGGVYVDDIEEAAEFVPPNFGFVHYTNQTGYELYEEMRCKFM